MIKKFLKLKRACPAKLQRSGGFTVLESIVAIAILSISIAGVFSAVQQGLSQAIIAKDEVKAFYLAQEAVEIIRNKRDSNRLYKIANPPTSNTWLYGITQYDTDPCYFGKTCKADATGPNLSSCSGGWGTCDVLRQKQDDPNKFLHGYDSNWPATNFKREIQIESVQNDSFGNPIEIAVTVRISWTKGVIPLEFKIKTLLFNW